MQSPVDDIKARLDIVDFIGTYISLTRAGANFKACCPFHGEKTPSFMVSKPKQIWHCFGCNEGGDIFKFLMKIDGLEFPEALKILADKAGVTLPRYDARAQSQKNTLIEIVKKSADFYASQLQSQKGQLAREYLARRGVSEAIVKQFGLGYAPDSWDALTIHMRDSYKADDVFAAGLAIKRERAVASESSRGDGRSLSAATPISYYDRFRNRIMFPIRDVHGNPVGFTSRLLDETRAEGKYVNTPETPIYNKSRILYGLDAARQKIREQDYAIIVEGNMDVIACHQFEMENVVAASGTALTIDHIRLLKRYTNNVMICFDADNAGQIAAKRGIDIALSQGMRVKVVVLPPDCGKDPDDCIRKNLKAWRGAVAGAKEIMEYYIERAGKQFKINTAHGRSQFTNMLLAEIKKLPDLVEQDFWLKKIAEAAGTEVRLLNEQMKKSGITPSPGLSTSSKPPSPRGRGEGEGGPRPRFELISERLLALMLVVPKIQMNIIAAVLPEMLSPPPLQALYTSIVACYTAYNSNSSVPSGTNFRQFWRNWAAQLVPAAPDTISTADILELYGDKEFEGWDSAQSGKETQFLLSELRREYIKRHRNELALLMKKAEQEDNSARVNELAREFEILGD
ncbi:MAG: DNA primase [bacterium]|nr:DNA primase [bacterium]